MHRSSLFVLVAVAAACSSDGATPGDAGLDAALNNPDGSTNNPDGSTNNPDGSTSNPDGSVNYPDAASGTSPMLGGCAIFPANHIFNTKIDWLPVHPNNAAFLTTIGTHKVHLDLGTQTDQTQSDFYGIPWNLVHAASIPWPATKFYSADSSLNWDPKPESDCGNGNAHTLVSPCIPANAPNPDFPIPANPIVEGGIDTTPSQPYGDHHILMLDQDSCRLWETYHSYPDGQGGWDIFGSSTWDLTSNALRHADWSSADAAGFPILPLLLKAAEASSGTIAHALRFTIASGHIRTSYVWPARHLTTNGTASTNLPQMGQLFRLKASYAIPANYNTQSKAILQAMKSYGMYIADGGSDMYVTGDPNASWASATFSQVQTLATTDFEAVDITPITSHAGFDPSSGAVP